MNIWWLAIDKNNEWCTYKELKSRCVVAQGWPEFGNLSTKMEFRNNLKRHEVEKEIKRIGDEVYKRFRWWKHDRESRRTPRIFWNLFKLKAGDLIVGIEGTNVRGICELPQNGIEGYTYDKRYSYAHGFGGKVHWVDWSENLLGIPPTPPRHSVHGIARLLNQSSLVKAAWRKYLKKSS